MALEYAKDVVWEGSLKKLENQIYIFGKQQNRIYRLNGKVDVIITDSPLLHSIVYDINNDNLMEEMIVIEHKKYNNLTFFVQRTRPYEQHGRTQNVEQAKKIDESIKIMLNKHNVPFQIINAGPESTKIIVNKILSILETEK